MSEIIFLFILVVININCKKTQTPIVISENTDYRSNFRNFNLITQSGQVFLVSLDSIGNVFSINSDTTNEFQTIFFNSKKKVSNIFNYKNNKLDGRAYYFNENSGFLEGDFNYKNGIKSGNAVLYYDTSALLKETMLYNDLGELYFREKYDRKGKVIGREGNDGSDSIK